ncbi:putative ABC transporter ATP-binding protein YbhF [Candidatus Thermoflexus japonica]|uniref:Putative ABC transporter ATP-binding protein YbhF n=1 Tax=Candidatus Thermoflexus japonica TaxID=2035417 RepID=A0A2H5Y8R2_9CHLR|nr:putative ABC transporter ATP-binding protein YbhF [Candidatus Thermoflexus japonica]
MRVVIEVQELRKAYGSRVAVDGVSFEVYEGEIFGMVGPNGAGKTTTIECIEGLRQPDSGRIRVLGMDPGRQGRALRARIGIQLQEGALSHRLRVEEALWLFTAFYPRPLDPETLLQRLGLAEHRRKAFDQLSGGLKQRLFIALALIGNPEILFLDELTTGLDPHARRAMWDLVQEIRAEGRTVFLTTHYMEEAERLCDRVAIIDRGRLVALDTPENLIRSLGAEQRVIFTRDTAFDPSFLTDLPGVSRVEAIGERVVIYGRGDSLVGRVVEAMAARGMALRDMRVERPTLEDVYLALTGRPMETPGQEILPASNSGRSR